jgi:hypothetical protein
LIELAQQGLAINLKNNLMRTPIYLAEKKRSKFAYQALFNLEKAITMANAFVDRRYGSGQPKSGSQLQLKSSLKQSISPKKKIRIRASQEEMADYIQEDHKAVEKNEDKLAKRNSHLEHLQKLMHMRSSISRSSMGSFGKEAQKAIAHDEDKDAMLLEIIEREKDEIRQVEEQLKFTHILKEKQTDLTHHAQIEKIKRWQVINQKREMREEQRQDAHNRDLDPFKVANELEQEQEQERLNNKAQELELSSATDEEERDRNFAEREKKGKFVTFKQFMVDKNISQDHTNNDDVVKIRHSSPKKILEKVPEEPEIEHENEEEESEIEEELDFTNNNRSFEKHPVEAHHNSDVEDDQSVRMSSSTMRNIKSRKRNRSTGPVGRSVAYVDAHSIAEQSANKISKFFKWIGRYIHDRYVHLKEWMIVEKEVKKRSKSKPSKKLKMPEEVKRPKLGREEMIFEQEVKMQAIKEIEKPKGKSMAGIMKKHRTFGKTAEELIFEQDDSDFDSEQPSVLLRKKIDKLKRDEQKLKEIEMQIDQDLRELRGAVPEEEIEAVKRQIDNKLNDKKNKKKRRKKKQNKVHHNMQKMKHDNIKKIMDERIGQFSESEEKPKKMKNIKVKDFKSDHDSYSRPRDNEDNEENENKNYSKSSPKCVDIHIEPLNNVLNASSPKNVQSLTPNIHSLKPCNSPSQSKEGTLSENQPEISGGRQFLKNKSNILGLKDYSDHNSVNSENKRYRSVERPQNFMKISLPAFNRKFTDSKYSLSHRSDEGTEQSQEPKRKVLRSVGSVDKVHAFEIKNVKADMKDSLSEEEVKFDEQEQHLEVSKPTHNDQNYISEEIKIVEEIEIPQDITPVSKNLPKNYDEIVKKSLDFATFLKNQANEVNDIRDSNLSDVLRVQKHVERLVKNPDKLAQLQKSSEKNTKLRQTLDFILSDSDDSFGNPDPREIKESINAFERRSLEKQSEGILKSMKEVIKNAKVCLSNNDFSNPILSNMHLIKKEKTIPENEIHPRFGDELDDLIDDDYLEITPSDDGIINQEKQVVETLGDELNEIYQNYGDELFDFEEDNDSQT